MGVPMPIRRTLPPGRVAWSHEYFDLIESRDLEGKKTYIDTRLNTTRYTRTLKHGIYLSHLPTTLLIDLSHLLRHPLRNLKLFFYRIPALHRHEKALVRELVVNSELHASSIYVCDDYRASAGYLRHGCDEQTNGSGAEHEDCRAWG
jgi:hypothetical protein